ncbi:hypothetical protein HQ560_22370 [bacterium]|nr:hypothetical protein [bacterium]
MGKKGWRSGSGRVVLQALIAGVLGVCLLGEFHAARGETADAGAAYAKESEAVWALFAQRKYTEAGDLLAGLGAKPEVKVAAPAYQADVEAGKLLRSFWKAVEGRLAERKGQFISIDGASGAIVGLKDGVLSIQRGKATLSRRVDQLTTKQALAYAKLATDERSSLMKGVFLLAERTLLDAAKAALAAAGETGHAAAYRARLEGAMAERAAEGGLPGWTPGKWQDLFGVSNTKKWALVATIGDVAPGRRSGVKVGIAVLQAGKGRCGIRWTDEFPKTNYEVTFLANRDEGKRFGDFVFPVGDGACSWVIGGWGDGTHTGIEKIDGRSYKDKKNPTRGRANYERGRWYRFRLRVTDAMIETWVDGREVIRLSRAGHTFSENDVAGKLSPFGFGAYNSTLGIKSLRARVLDK